MGYSIDLWFVLVTLIASICDKRSPCLFPSTIVTHVTWNAEGLSLQDKVLAGLQKPAES